MDVLVALTHLGSWEDTALAHVAGREGARPHRRRPHRGPLRAPAPRDARRRIADVDHAGRPLRSHARARRPRGGPRQGARVVRAATRSSRSTRRCRSRTTSPSSRSGSSGGRAGRAACRSPHAARGERRTRDDRARRSRGGRGVGGRCSAARSRRVLVGPAEGRVTLQRMYDAVLVQRQPSGTNGFTSLFVVEVTGAELTALRARMQSPLHDMLVPAKIDPKRTYKLAIEKRRSTYPKVVFGSDPKLPAVADAKLGGELIDVLEAYGRSRAARASRSTELRAMLSVRCGGPSRSPDRARRAWRTPDRTWRPARAPRACSCSRRRRSEGRRGPRAGARRSRCRGRRRGRGRAGRRRDPSTSTEEALATESRSSTTMPSALTRRATDTRATAESSAMRTRLDMARGYRRARARGAPKRRSRVRIGCAGAGQSARRPA